MMRHAHEREGLSVRISTPRGNRSGSFREVRSEEA